MRVLVIIPTYNEAENIKSLIPEVLAQGEKLGSSVRIEVLVVDDNSPDGTAQIVKEFQKVYEDKVHLIERPGKLGLGTAYVEGFKYALKNGYDYVFEMDADFSHDPKEIPKILNGALDSYDIVIGSRYSHGVSVLNWPMSRVLLSYFANLYARKMTGVPIMDLTSGFKCISRRVLEKIDLDGIRSNGYAFQIELTVKAYYKGLKIKEHPIIFVERRSGVSKMSKKIVFEAALMVLRLSAYRFLKLFKRRKNGS
ncbi:polyprenol monophosphomannose synthase [Candidatus Chrysopegis kryptomonas]|jgi:dolichol-phosphate mannosyltransferase|uniref:Dolichol-phosphate mannosyltransferase n=1 Tax=Candidatus Chryseopegocella kryptomonas TaxID=1633643 RepID=A0A0P1NV17_9BACT|nr:polyprenol monophosphomannose synthase [Candidatus Chrysopegis kryptomonas]CUT02918.1 dolichol-phosphate mannosyltransferase [Candidatus Chrysopegis kryptomonas]